MFFQKEGKKVMKIVVGLGNPGEKYNKTRHNVGWLFLDYLSEIYGIEVQKNNCDALVGEKNIDGEKIIFAKPMTFMNLSGNAVQKLKNWYKVEDKDIMILFDDIDIPFGTFRYREKGSGGSHNGMKDVVQKLGAQDIKRVRIGLGGLKHEKQDMVDFVLQRFSKDELVKLEEVFAEASKQVDEFIKSK